MVSDMRTACPHGNVGPFNQRICGCKLLVMPYSEVCVHMKVAEKVMWASPTLYGKFKSTTMVQLFTLDNKPYSIPVTRGEAGYEGRPVL
jgi:hypothetical protein